MVFTTVDSDFIYDEYTLRDFFDKHGLDYEDIKNIMCKDELEHIRTLKDVADDHELCADGYLQNMLTAENELDAIAQKLRSGRGLTKDKAAAAIDNIRECYLLM